MDVRMVLFKTALLVGYIRVAVEDIGTALSVFRELDPFRILEFRTVVCKDNGERILEETISKAVGQGIARPNAASKMDDGSKEKPNGYYFANQDEFLIYTTVEKPTENLYWLSGDNYVDAFERGYSLFDSGNIQEAVSAFNEAISWNPVAIDARFELIHCYYALKQIDAALGSLHYVERYLGRSKDIARYYRAFGYYFVEKGDYRRGAAAYKLSLDYEKNQMAFGEMSAICNSYGVNLSGEDINRLVESGGAALLSPWFDKLVEEALSDESDSKPNTPVSDEQFRCPVCHNVLPKDSEFCQYCGTALSKEPKPSQVSENKAVSVPTLEEDEPKSVKEELPTEPDILDTDVVGDNPAIVTGIQSPSKLDNLPEEPGNINASIQSDFTSDTEEDDDVQESAIASSDEPAATDTEQIHVSWQLIPPKEKYQKTALHYEPKTKVFEQMTQNNSTPKVSSPEEPPVEEPTIKEEIASSVESLPPDNKQSFEMKQEEQASESVPEPATKTAPSSSASLEHDNGRQDHTQKQNNLLFIIIGLLIAIIVLLLIFLLKPGKSNTPAPTTAAIKQTSEVAATEPVITEAETTITTPETSATEFVPQQEWPEANPVSMDRLDPFGYVDGGRLFYRPIDNIIEGMEVDKDYRVVDIADDGSVKLYTLFPRYEYFGVPAGDTGIRMIEGQDAGVTLLYYDFVLDSADKEGIVTTFSDIIQDVTENYGKRFDFASLVRDGETENDWIAEQEFKDEINASTKGAYQFVWLFSNYDISVHLDFDPDKETSLGYVTFVPVSEVP